MIKKLWRTSIVFFIGFFIAVSSPVALAANAIAPAQGSDTDYHWVCSEAGLREPNVVVDIGYGPQREYWSKTNEFGQVIEVWAKEIILQDDATEPVTSKNRYCNDEAKVPGTEAKDLDEGHIIADSLGGVSNAYNITPQDSHLNREGEQFLMEDSIRKAGGAYDFYMEIKYLSTDTQIPQSYSVRYILKGQEKETVMEYGNGRYGQVDSVPMTTMPTPTSTDTPTTAPSTSAVLTPSAQPTFLPYATEAAPSAESTESSASTTPTPSATPVVNPDSDLARTGSMTRQLTLCLLAMISAAYALYRVRSRA